MMTQSLGDVGEFGLIRRIRDLIDRKGIQNPDVSLSIGDDCASFLPHAGYELLVTCDCMVEGRHYLRKHISPMDLGRRAMVMNISDIGAMGGYPLYALISLGLREDTQVKDVDDMYIGFIEELESFKASIIGGNITRLEQSDFIDITLIGEVENNVIIRRSTARRRDSILVTGYPGQAAAGLRMLLNNPDMENIETHPLVMAYNRPFHRAKEGRAIAKSRYASAMIDTSDGLLGDLGHICEQSGVGAEIIQTNLPISEHIREIPNAHDIVMNESDDYELIITCSTENVENIRSIVAEISNIPVTEIGKITDVTEGMRIISADGLTHKISPKGWDHFKG